MRCPHCGARSRAPGGGAWLAVAAVILVALLGGGALFVLLTGPPVLPQTTADAIRKEALARAEIAGVAIRADRTLRLDFDLHNRGAHILKKPVLDCALTDRRGRAAGTARVTLPDTVRPGQSLRVIDLDAGPVPPGTAFAACHVADASLHR